MIETKNMEKYSISPEDDHSSDDVQSGEIIIDKASERKVYEDELGSGSIEQGRSTIDIASEKSFVRKCDFFLLPYLSIMYFFNAVDRSNISNAYTDGFTKDMHFATENYSLLLLLFCIPNALCDLPLNLLTKRFSGKWVLPTIMLIWGGLSIIQAGCTNFGGMLTVRLLIGATEAGFFAGVIFYLTLFYTRRELAFRIAVFFGSAIIAAAFSGLLAFGVFQIKNGPLHGWQYLFIIEGAATVALALFGYYWLPASASQGRWFTPEEKAAALARSLRDSSSKVDSKFSWKECFDHMKSKEWWIYAAISFLYPLPWTTASMFLPQIVGLLGFDAVKTNLWTVAPNCVGTVVLGVVAFSSDRMSERAYHICFALCLSLIGLIILAAIDVTSHKAVAYFAMFMLVSGAYIPSCLVHSWHNNNNLSETSRAFDTGIYVGISNLAAMLATGTFRAQYAPQYRPTLIVTAVCAFLCLILTFIYGTYLKLENKKRDRLQGIHLKPEDVDTSTLKNGYSDPNWRFCT